jgi:hypothetical protein
MVCSPSCILPPVPPPCVPQRYLKPTLARQKKARMAVYNRAKATRQRLVEELLADPGLCPF